jgi:hypothetical protein
LLDGDRVLKVDEPVGDGQRLLTLIRAGVGPAGQAVESSGRFGAVRKRWDCLSTSA